MPRIARAFAFVLPALAVACGDTTENDAPIIDSVEAPLVVKEIDGAYAIPVTVLFHDNDGEAVTHLRYRLPPNIEGIIDVPSPNPSLESAVITIVIRAKDVDADQPTTRSQSGHGDDDKNDKSGKDGDDDKHGSARPRSRARALQLSIVDYRGAESLPQSSTVTLD
jgi:hypothetical protein